MSLWAWWIILLMKKGKVISWEKKEVKMNNETTSIWHHERSWKIYTEIVPNCQKAKLQAIIRWRIDPSSIINTDGRRWYDGLVDIVYDKHFRVNHSKNEFSNKSWVHINWIEAYRSYSKRRLAKFNWIKVNFYLHLKECERRYKKTDIELVKELYKMLFHPWRKVAKRRKK
jgi:transposase-like protein